MKTGLRCFKRRSIAQSLVGLDDNEGEEHEEKMSKEERGVPVSVTLITAELYVYYIHIFNVLDTALAYHQQIILSNFLSRSKKIRESAQLAFLHVIITNRMLVWMIKLIKNLYLYLSLSLSLHMANVVAFIPKATLSSAC